MSEENSSIKQLFNSAYKFYQNGDLKEAKVLLKQNLESFPKHLPSIFLLGTLSAQNKKYQTAKKLLQQAIELKPDFVEGHNNLGNVFQELGDYQKATTCYQNAIKLNPKYAEAHYNLGKVYKELDKNQEAITCYQSAIKLDPNYTESHNNLGNAYKELNKYQEAISCYQTAIKLNPKYAEAHYNLGRPQGQFIKKYSLKFLAKILEGVLSIQKIYFVSPCFGEIVNRQIQLMKPGDICLLENVRFHEEEEKNGYNFSESLAKYFDIYINDAFSASHRNHASIVGITRYLPSIAGNSFIKEIKNLNNLLYKPTKPTTAIIGGSKVSTKLKLLNNLIEIFDTLIIGGAMANTFLLAKGFNMGKSLFEKDLIVDAQQILEKSINSKIDIILPVDLICSNSITDKANIQCVESRNLLPHQVALDIGDETVKLIKSSILKSKIILWNGPLGTFEHKPFDNGTNQVAEIIKTNAKKLNMITIAGGGDTVAAIKNAKAENFFTYISTAGGAFLEWLEGKESPGVKALKDNSFS